MTQEQKRIKIAEKVGWKFHPLTEHLYSEQEKADAIMCWVRPGNDPWQMECVPDYFNDLNAMHEAEKIIEQSCKEGDYWFYLHEACGFPEAESDWSKCDYFAAVHATASKRAEAFGKALNLW